MPESGHKQTFKQCLLYGSGVFKREMDLLIEENGVFYPIEIKKTASVHNSSFKGFHMLDNLKMPIGHGSVICMASSLTPLGDGVDAVPAGYL